jgi:methylmalonyl-CoA mutase cobalamin-binding subunit
MRSRLLFCGDVDGSARGLRDRGHEVVVLEPGVAPEQLAAVAVQEDIDVVAVSDLDLGARAVPALGEAVVVFWVTSDPGAS